MNALKTRLASIFTTTVTVGTLLVSSLLSSHAEGSGPLSPQLPPPPRPIIIVYTGGCAVFSNGSVVFSNGDIMNLDDEDENENDNVFWTGIRTPFLYNFRVY